MLGSIEFEMAPFSSPLPLVGRGRGWGSWSGAHRAPHLPTPTPHPSPPGVCEAVVRGMGGAAGGFSVRVVGGHTNARPDRGQLSVAILGRAKRLLTSFDARPGDRLVAAIDLRGRYRAPFANWEAATDAPAGRLRGDLDVLPAIAEAGLSCAPKATSPRSL